jgi:hypothetical protein
LHELGVFLEIDFAVIVVRELRYCQEMQNCSLLVQDL